MIKTADFNPKKNKYIHIIWKIHNIIFFKNSSLNHEEFFDYEYFASILCYFPFK